MRLAWFSPLPPEPSGIAAYTSELLPELAGDHAIDCFTDRRSSGHVAGARDVHDAHDFVWRHAREPYDLAVYQLGNSTCHDYMWAYLAHYPGLVVLHDAQLHHARGKALLKRHRDDDYRAELAFDHPDAPAGVAELGIYGRLAAATYFWPMLRAPLEMARLAAVHSPWLARTLSDDHPAAVIETIRMGVADPLPATPPDAGRTIRERHGLTADAVVFSAFGGVTPEKGIASILGALPSVVAAEPAAHLMLIGSEAEHYDAVADARRRGVADRVTLTGFVDDADLPTYLAAADVCLCLRWPTAHETSASWLRCLAAGKPTVITQLAHTTDVPTLVTRGAWSPSHLGPSAAMRDPADAEPIAGSIDILDEKVSLALTMRRLARDGGLRRRLGVRARAYWSRHHTLAHMAADYTRVLSDGAGRPATTAGDDRPLHLRRDGADTAREILRPFGVASDVVSTTGPRKP